MTSFTSADPTDSRSDRSGRRRRRFPAVSGIHLLIVAAGILALVANLALLRRNEAPLTEVVVSRVDLVAGRDLRSEDIEMVPIDVTEPVASGLIFREEWSDYQGWVVLTRTAAGSLLTKANLQEPQKAGAFRAMSLPIEIEHAAGGDLIPGDLVDVIRVDEDGASFVATGVPVLAVPGQAEGALGLSSSFYLVLEVDDRTALTLALALAHADVEVIRSTGSDSVTVRSLREGGSTSFGDAWPVSGSDQVIRPDLDSQGAYPPFGGGLLP